MGYAYVSPARITAFYVILPLNDLISPQMNRARLVIDSTINVVTVVGGRGISPTYEKSIRRATIPAENPLKTPMTNDVSILYLTLR